MAATGKEELPLDTPGPKRASDWSLDRKFLLYDLYDSKMRTDIWALPMEKEPKPFPVIQTGFEAQHG